MSNVHVNPRHARANTPQQVVCLLAPRTHNTQPKTATGRQQDTPSRVTDDSTAIEPHTLRCDVDWRARALCRFRARSTKTKRREGRAAARASESRAFPQPISKNAAPSSANNPLKQQHRQGTQGNVTACQCKRKLCSTARTLTPCCQSKTGVAVRVAWLTRRRRRRQLASLWHRRRTAACHAEALRRHDAQMRLECVHPYWLSHLASITRTSKEMEKHG